MTLDAFALRTTDTAWIRRNRGEVEDGRVYVLVPGVDRLTFAGQPMLRYTFNDVPADFPNGTVMCPQVWVDPHVDCQPDDHYTDVDGTDPREQAWTSDGELACNHCGPDRPMAYCSRLGEYIHLTRPEEGCFLIPGRG